MSAFYIADLKNKKASLETSVQRAQRDVQKLAEPQVIVLIFSIAFDAILLISLL